VSEITDNLTDWYKKYYVQYDRHSSELPLFTRDTQDAFDNCIEKVSGIVDKLGIDTLFEAIKPSRWAK
jgi:hypothetical protein